MFRLMTVEDLVGVIVVNRQTDEKGRRMLILIKLYALYY